MKSELKDEKTADILFDRIIESYDCVENYLILFAYGVYDIPGKTNDNAVLDDASEDVYSFVLCSICPVELAKPGLCFDNKERIFTEYIRDRMLQVPETGFLFPAFTDRNTDIHNILLYNKKADHLHLELTEHVYGCENPTSAQLQKECFDQAVVTAFDGKPEFDNIKDIYERIVDREMELQSDAQSSDISPEEVVSIIQDCGGKENLDACRSAFNDPEDSKEMKLSLSNLIDTKKMTIESSGLKMQIASDQISQLETKYIDGRPCIVIPIESGMTVNGIEL